MVYRREGRAMPPTVRGSRPAFCYSIARCKLLVVINGTRVFMPSDSSTLLSLGGKLSGYGWRVKMMERWWHAIMVADEVYREVVQSFKPMLVCYPVKVISIEEK